MPYVDKQVQARIFLYQRCRQNGTLPREGGLLDQDELTIQDFDVIDELAAKYRREEHDRANAELRSMQALRDMAHG